MAADPARRTLNLDDITFRDFIRVDGTDYPVVTIGRMPPAASAEFQRLFTRSLTLERQGSLTDEEKAELPTLLDAMCRLVLLAPDAVHAALTDHQRVAVVEVFFQPSVTSTEPGTALPESPSIGVSGAPGSNGSMAATH